jgi:glycerol-3-phosphate dehydrogenase
MLEMLMQAGARLRLYTFAAEAIVENNVLKGVVADSKSGRQALLKGKIVVDCTGDGDIAMPVPERHI